MPNPVIPEELRQKALKGVAKDFVMFSRNGRWGTCERCPIDATGMLYPEFCVNTRESSHQRSASILAAMFQMKLDNALTMAEEPPLCVDDPQSPIAPIAVAPDMPSFSDMKSRLMSERGIQVPA